jgi:hypothetical protein
LIFGTAPSQSRLGKALILLSGGGEQGGSVLLRFDFKLCFNCRFWDQPHRDLNFGLERAIRVELREVQLAPGEFVSEDANILAPARLTLGRRLREGD